MNECPDCANYTTRVIPHRLDGGRYAEFCNRNGSSIQFERDVLGSCGSEGRFFVSTALHSVES